MKWFIVILSLIVIALLVVVDPSSVTRALGSVGTFLHDHGAGVVLIMGVGLAGGIMLLLGNRLARD